MPLTEGMTQSEWSHYQRLLKKGERFGLRYLGKKDRDKCGCCDCLYARIIRKEKVLELWTIDGLDRGSYGSLFCPHEECPYMDEFKEFKTYEDFDRAEKIKWKNKTFHI